MNKGQTVATSSDDNEPPHPFSLGHVRRREAGSLVPESPIHRGSKSSKLEVTKRFPLIGNKPGLPKGSKSGVSNQSSPVSIESTTSQPIDPGVSYGQAKVATIIATGRLPGPDPNERKTRRKYVKGGLADRMAKLVNRQRASLAFWAHGVKKNCEMGIPVEKQGKKSLKLQIVSTPVPMGSVYAMKSRPLIYGDIDVVREKLVLFSRESVSALRIQRGSFVTVVAPWQIVQMPGFEDTILCTNFCASPFVGETADVDQPESRNADLENFDHPAWWQDVVSALDASDDDGETNVGDRRKSPIGVEETLGFGNVAPSTSRSPRPSPLESKKAKSLTALPPPSSMRVLNVRLLFCLPTSGSVRSESKTLFCQLPSSSKLLIVVVSSLESLAPSVVDALRRRRSVGLRVECVQEKDGDSVHVHPEHCVLEDRSIPKTSDPMIPMIWTPHSRPNTLVSFTGRITGVDYNNAFSHRVCPDCQAEVEDENDVVDCQKCRKEIVPVENLTLHVFCVVGGERIRVKLTSSFVRGFLPRRKETEDHYDVKAVLGRTLDRISCLVESDTNQKERTLLQLEFFR